MRKVTRTGEMTEAPATAPGERDDTALIWRNAIAIGIARLGSVILDGLAYIVTARYFGPAAYGNYLSILVFLNLVDVAADMTVMDVTVREMSKATLPPPMTITRRPSAGG